MDGYLGVGDLARRFNMSTSTARRLIRTNSIPGEMRKGRWFTTEQNAQRWLETNGQWVLARVHGRVLREVVVPSRLSNDLYFAAMGSRAYPLRGKRVPHDRFEELERLGFRFNPAQHLEPIEGAHLPRWRACPPP